MITVNDIERDEAKINGVAEMLLESLQHNFSNVTANKELFREFKDSLKQLNRLLPYYAKMEKTERNIHFARGRLIGVCEIYQNLIELSEKAEYHSHTIDDVFAAIKTISHGDEVLESLSLSRGINHKELSNIIGIDVSTLTGIMDKLENLNLIYYTKIGKFKFYYLSDLGQSYKDEKKTQPKMRIKELELQLQKEREKVKQLERERSGIFYEYGALWSESIMLKFNQNILEAINKISDKDNNMKSAKVVFGRWGKEMPLKISNKCVEYN